MKLRERFGDQAIFNTARKKFFAEHPDCPRPKPIPCLDLVLRREYAEQIFFDEKRVEIRSYSAHYCGRLYDKDVLTYEEKHWDNELMKMQMIDFNDSVRAVETLHFHNYNNTWFLDVECIDNNTVVLVDDQVKFLQDEYDFHEFDEELDELNKQGAKERPIYFYFAIGAILGTNLF